MFGQFTFIELSYRFSFCLELFGISFKCACPAVR